MLYSRYDTLQARIYRRNTGRFPKRAPEGPGACFPGKFFWISTSWVSETFRQDVGQFHSASDEALQIGDYYYYFLSPEIGKNIIQTIFQKKKSENLTDFRKTVETKLDPRLPFLEV